MAQEARAAARAGHSGMPGGFAEEAAFLDAVASEILPEDHELRDHLDMMLHRIRHNAQWPWAYKVKAAQVAARGLKRAEGYLE